MSRKSQATKTKAKPVDTDRSGNWLTRLLFRPKVLLFLAMAVSSTVVVPILLDRLPALSARQEYRLPSSEIVYSVPPHCVPLDLLQQVIDRAGLPQELSLLDKELTEEIAQAFQLHPWVESVRSVRKSIPARVEVDVVYRRPVAMVRVAQGMYPIDSQGILLPPADFTVSDAKRYPLIDQVRSTPQGAAGTRWGDRTVAAAARLAYALAEHWHQFGLATIRVPSPRGPGARRSAHSGMANSDPDSSESVVGASTDGDDDLVLELVTIGGSTIIWGRAPGSDHPGELSVTQKIGRLEKYLKEFDSFDQPHGPYEIDIRHWQEISRRPLTARPGRTRRL